MRYAEMQKEYADYEMKMALTDAAVPFISYV
jgi:hypothetical protein